MPRSDEVFGDGPKAHNGSGALLGSGAAKLASGMFPNITAGLFGGDPTPEEMSDRFEAALHTKQVKIKKFGVETFDLNEPEQVKAYQKLYLDLYQRVSRGETLVKEIDKKFIKGPTPRWIVHIEWLDYALLVDGKEMTPEKLEKLRQKDSALGKKGKGNARKKS